MICKLEGDAPIFQCVPNFSEGRRTDVVAAIVDSAREVERRGGVRVIDWSADTDHNRMVVTLLGEELPVAKAMLAMARCAVENIDLRKQTGVHPRIGAIDVLPVVPIRGATFADANRLAQSISQSIGNQLLVPVCLYEQSAHPGKLRALPAIRKVVKQLLQNPTDGQVLPSDYGPTTPHPSAGVTVAGARAPLTAYNIDLNTQNVAVAEAIAADIRKQRAVIPSLQGVRALGLFLDSRNCAQVSMNLTVPAASPMPAVFNYVAAAAQRLGAEPTLSEIIGVVPAVSLGNGSPEQILWHDFRAEKVIESWFDA